MGSIVGNVKKFDNSISIQFLVIWVQEKNTYNEWQPCYNYEMILDVISLVQKGLLIKLYTNSYHDPLHLQRL